jgi:hypothetical protein
MGESEAPPAPNNGGVGEDKMPCEIIQFCCTRRLGPARLSSSPVREEIAPATLSGSPIIGG